MFDSPVCLWPIVHTPQMSRKHGTAVDTLHSTTVYTVPFRAIFENTMGNNFFTFLNTDQNAQVKFFVL